MPHDFLQVLSSTFVVIARFMRATQFSPSKRKMGCPDKPGNDT
jgi:hypothetical protein